MKSLLLPGTDFIYSSVLRHGDFSTCFELQAGATPPPTVSLDHFFMEGDKFASLARHFLNSTDGVFLWLYVSCSLCVFNRKLQPHISNKSRNVQAHLSIPAAPEDPNAAKTPAVVNGCFLVTNLYVSRIRQWTFNLKMLM